MRPFRHAGWMNVLISLMGAIGTVGRPKVVLVGEWKFLLNIIASNWHWAGPKPVGIWTQS